MSKTLTAKVSVDTSSAIRNLTKLENKMRSIDATLKKSQHGLKLSKELKNAVIKQEQLKQATLKTALAEEKLTTQKNKTALAAEKLKKTTDKTTNSTNSLVNSVKKLASAYLGVMTAKAAITASDTITSAENKLNNLNGGDTNLTSSQMDKMYSAAQSSRSGYSDMMSNVAKSMTLAGNAFKGNVDNAIRFQEIMAKSYTIGGASAAEQSSSMYQLIQGLGSGILQGDELRSVREGAPIAYKEIEKFAQGIYGADKNLKDLASQGKITSDIVVAAMMNAGESIDSAFAETDMTFAQVWTTIKNDALNAFRAVQDELNELINGDTAKKLLAITRSTINGIANLVVWLVDVVTTALTWIADNWHWLRYILIGALTALALYFIYVGVNAVISAIDAMMAWTTVQWTVFAIIAGLTLMVIGIIWVANTTQDGCNFMVKALLVVAGVLLLIGIIVALVTGNIVLLVIGGIVLLLALFIKFADYILGGLYVLGAAIVNIVIGLMNGIIQLIWSFMEPFVGIIEWILNVCQGGFDSFGGAVANLIGQIISWFLSLGKVVTKIIDAIFGTNWTAGLNSLQDKVLSWGKNENAITLNREATTIDRISYTDAWNTGKQHGSAVQDWVGNLGDKVKGALTFNTDGKKLKTGSSTFNVDDFSDIASGVDDTAKNTDKMADSMELSAEDLKYLRQIAEMEWKKEYTTASIKVAMTNNNSINGESDLDGLVTKLTEKLYEELNVVADGVYAV